MILDFCSFKSFFSIQADSPKLDALKDCIREDKKERSELIYVDDPEDILKDAVSMLKKCTEDSTSLVYDIADKVPTENSGELIYKL